MAVTKRYGIMVDLDTGNPIIENGDFVIGETRLQEAISIIRAVQNEYTRTPLVGCNLILFQNGMASKSQLERIMKKQIEADGLDYADIIKQIEVNG